MTDAWWTALFFVFLVLLIPASLAWTALRSRRGRRHRVVAGHVTDRIGFDTLVDLERNRAANRT